MRVLQVGLLVFGALCLFGAVPFIGGVAGDALWRAGVAILLLDIVLILLWPRPERNGGNGIVAGSVTARAPANRQYR